MNIVLTTEHSSDPRRYNASSVPEIAAIILDNVRKQNVLVVKRQNDNKLEFVSSLNPMCDPLHYVILFPHGDQGWGLRLHTKRTDGSNMTLMQYAAARMMIRPGQEHLFRCGRLFQEYAADSYSRIEAARLCYFETHQKEIRADLYQGVVDGLLQDDGNMRNMGKKILPDSFIGGPRHMHRLCQDGVAIIRHCGKPDLFITMTCNPKWPEITENLLPGQQAQDRPDLVSRVFKLKFDKLRHELESKQLFGGVKAWIHTIEFQKRGLPNAHILISLLDKDKTRTTEDYTIVSA